MKSSGGSEAKKAANDEGKQEKDEAAHDKK
jgi:hypothetical protein